MSISDNLFLSVSNILDIRVTPDTLRTKMDQVSSLGGITAKVKTEILIEILIAFYELEKKLNEK